MFLLADQCHKITVPPISIHSEVIHCQIGKLSTSDPNSHVFGPHIKNEGPQISDQFLKLHFS